ncbi:MAG: NAD-dependent epimerase/dehydratase family protein, partial [Phycisphaerae bacterium]|nr:NAD-dependent epimerase/dehydratase family protein [Phycisphaerae bacterium]
MRIGVTGASGFIGTALCRTLALNGITVLRLVRHESTVGCEVTWNPKESFEPDSRLERLDAIVHLAGAGIASQRWTPARRELLLRSRVDGTRFLVEALQRLHHPPAAFIQASGIGLYGNRGDEILTEDSPRGEGFLPGLVSAWEKAGEPIERCDTRR